MFILDNGLARRAKAKLRTSGGFSLPELLVTMLILLLMTAIATDGLPAVVRTYRKTVDIANAETYLNTTMIVLRNRLTLASGVEVVDGKKLRYIDSEIGRCQISVDLGNGGEIQYAIGLNDKWEAQIEEYKNPTPLVRMKPENFIASYETIGYDSGFVKIKGLQVKKAVGDGEYETLAKVDDEDEYVVHTLNDSGRD